jgi:anionic cell wall polymer biosynthesis LytR-Cps2A-Psr (LCP) family protein
VEYNQLEGRPEGTDYLDTSLSGNLHLNGPQALAFCRNRYIGTDFARTERQRKVLTAAVKNVPLALVTNAGTLVKGVMSNVTTNLTKTELSGLMMQAPMMLTYDMVSGSIPLEGTYSNANIRGMAVLEVDFEANKQYIREEIYGK